MKVSQLVRHCSEFQRHAGAGAPSVVFSKAWHPGKQRFDLRIPQEEAAGLYIFSQCAEPDWDFPAEQNQSDIWYMGTSSTHLGGRVWSHVGRVTDPFSGKANQQAFSQHRRGDVPNVRDDIARALTVGEFVVYTAAVTPLRPPGNGRGDWPAALEKYMLLQHFLDHGTLPPLNLSF